MMGIATKPDPRPCDERPGLLALLFVIYALAFGQRQLPMISAEILQLRLGLTDGAIAILVNGCFALPYALLAMPAGWLADRSDRLRLAGCGMGLASLATIASAFPATTEMVLLNRVAIGIGHAALVPACYSALGDVARPDRIGRAAAVFALAPFIGVALTLLLGGFLMSDRSSLGLSALVGGSGLATAAALALWPEPLRRERQVVNGRAPANWWTIVGTNLALALAAMGVHALVAWGAIWLVRSHHLAPSHAAWLMGGAILLGGVGGSTAIRAAARRWLKVRLGSLVWFAMANSAVALISPLLFSSSLAIAVVLLVPAMLFAAIALSSGPAALQEMTPAHLRGRRHGLAIAVVNLVGLAAGPALVGLLTDATGDRNALGGVLMWLLPVIFTLSALSAAFANLAQRRSYAIPGRPSSTT